MLQPIITVTLRFRSGIDSVSGRLNVYRSRLDGGPHVCCGMSGSALPAAERVGPRGQVVAVNLAQNLLDKGARCAVERDLTI